ncbi:unnamed protein product [Prorocentrum cordatum]|uniref:Uncharacterized protein n=1 Tax=Prorocentrum cordatum TaxID=2364126 RepID=A0ABN9PIN0_9DINO|nr:unnamed protein product [Polarella glacialis]
MHRPSGWPPMRPRCYGHWPATGQLCAGGFAKAVAGRSEEAVGVGGHASAMESCKGASVRGHHVLAKAERTWPNWHTFITRKGELVDMTVVCPADVAALLRTDVQAVLRQRWTEQEEYRTLAPAPLLQPVVAQMAARCFPRHANVRLVDDEQAVRVQHHAQEYLPGLWYFQCPRMRGLRLRGQPERQHVAEQQVDDLLWTRGLVRDPSADRCFQAAKEDQYHYGAIEGDDDLLTGGIVCDGSKLGTTCLA